MRRDAEVVIRGLADKLQVTMFDAAQLLALSDHIPIAAWGYDKQLGREQIWLNRSLTERLADDELIFIINHEVLHRAGYDEGYLFPDDQLGNVALDVAINKVLYLGDPELACRVLRRVYPPESVGNPVVLARGDLQPGEVAEKYRAAWQGIWNHNKVPAVYEVYFALNSAAQEVEDNAKQTFGGFDRRANSGPQPKGDGQGQSPSNGPSPDEHQEQPGQGSAVQLDIFGMGEDGELEPKEVEQAENNPNPLDSMPDHIMIRTRPSEAADNRVGDRVQGTANEAVKRVTARIKDDGGFSETFSNLFGKLRIVPEKTQTMRVEEWLSRIRGKEEADETVQRIFRAVGVEPGVDVIPINLTTNGILMLAAGISDMTSIYWTETPREARPTLGVYVDTSPSMANWAGRTVYIIDCLKDELPAEMFGFAGDVHECSTADFAQGEYYKGASTCFDRVIEHALEQDFEIVLIFTDGQSSVSWQNKANARRSKQRFFTIFCGTEGRGRRDGADLRDISEDCFAMLADPQFDSVAA